MKTKSFFNLIILAGLSTALIHCSGDSKSKKVKLSVVPDTPGVIDANFTVTIPPIDANSTATTKTVKAPWFPFKYKIFNGSDSVITVQTIKFTTTAVTDAGATVEYTSSIDPNELNSYYVVRVAVGETAAPSTIWFIDGLPETGGAHDYQVDGELIGWFGEPTDPQASMHSTFHFSASDTAN